MRLARGTVIRIMMMVCATFVHMLRCRSRTAVVLPAKNHQYPGVPAQRQRCEQQDEDQGFGKPLHEKNRITGLDDQTA